jgi:hypothetical protein
MSRKLIVSYFDKWLAKNLYRFKYKPIKIGFARYRFEGINDSIVLQITPHTRELTMLFHSPNKKGTISYEDDFDMRDISWFEKIKYIKHKGYIDKGWSNQYQTKYYNSYKELLHTELFEPLIEYCNNYFIEENHYYIMECKSGITMGLIGNTNDGKIVQELENTCIAFNNNMTITLDDTPRVYKFSLFEW